MNSIRTSINLKFDLSNIDVLNQYIPTNTHHDFLMAFLDGISRKSSSRAHIVYGPYGTGKTYLLNVLLSMTTNPKGFKESKLFSKFQKDLEFLEIIDSYNLFLGKKMNFYPIILNGYEGNLNEVLFDQLNDIAIENNIKLDINYQESFIGIIKNWEQEYPDTFQMFNKFLNEHSFSTAQFEKLIQKNNVDALKKFEVFYKKVTSGAEIPFKKKFNLVSALEKILEQLKKINKGIIFVYDEFGRFLQNINQENLINTLQDLQDLAELANNGSENFSFVLIAHKPISAYFSRFSTDYKPEFERIEKRFKAHFIKGNEKITYKLAKYFLLDSLQSFSKPKNYEEITLKNINSSNFFKDFSQKEIVEDLINGIYPFNPFSLFYLNVLSSVYGQNERSMMSFLDYSFKYKFSKITIYDINHYFFPSNDLIPDDSQYLRLLKKKINHNEALLKSKSLSDLYIFITFWYSLGLNKYASINSDSLSLIIGNSSSFYDGLLLSLEQEKLIRKITAISGYEPYESSGVNIEKVVVENFKNIMIDSQSFSNVLDDLLGFNNIKAHFYNYKYKMTRFASIHYNFGDNIGLEIGKNNKSDFVILINFVEENASQKDIKKFKDLYTDDVKILSIVVPVKLKQFIPRIEKLVSAKNLRANKSEYHSYNFFIEELDFLINENIESLKELLSKFIKFDFYKTYYLSEEVFINSYHSLIKALSSIFEKIYNKTLVINNDQVNKFKLTTVQKNALEILGNNLIKFIPMENTGSGPEVLAYLTIFIENHYQPFLYETTEFGNFSQLSKEILNLLKDTIEVRRLAELLSNVKFGYSFRKSIIPVLLLGVLRPIWDNLIFFGNNTFIKEIDYSFFETMLFDENTNYTVSRLIYDEHQTKVLNILIDKFKDYEENKYLPKHIRAFNSINNWLKRKGQFIQQTSLLDLDTVKIRDLFQQAEFVPLEAFSNLYKFVNKLDQSIEEIDNFLDKKRMEVFKIIESIFKEKSFAKMKIKATNLKKEIIVSNKLASTIMTSNSEYDLVDKLSSRILEKEFKDISDSIFEMLLKQVEILTKTALTGSFDKDQVNVLSLNEQIIAIQRVGSSVTGKNLKIRLEGMLSASKLRVSKEELVQILFEIFKEKVGE